MSNKNFPVKKNSDPKKIDTGLLKSDIEKKNAESVQKSNQNVQSSAQSVQKPINNLPLNQRRLVFIKMFIGYNNTGKSSMAEYYASSFYVNNPHSVIGGYDPQFKFQYLLTPEYILTANDGHAKGWWKRISRLRNYMLVFDDYRGFNTHDRPSRDMYELMEKRYQNGIDMIFICHNPKFVLAGLTAYISEYHIFYTMGQDSNFEDQIPNYEHCQRAAKLMRQYVRDYPDVIDNPDQFFDPVFFKHRFPHIIVDNIKGTLKPQFLKPEWIKKYADKFVIKQEHDETF